MLAITNWYPPHHTGGYELHCHDVLTRLARMGHEVEVLCSDTKLTQVADEPDEPGVRVHRRLRMWFRDDELWAPDVITRFRVAQLDHRALVEVLDRFQPDVVSAWHLAALPLGLLAEVRARSIPLVLVICDDWLTYAHRQDAWGRLFDGGVVRRSVGRAVEAVTGVPSVQPEITRDAVCCFVSDHTRNRASSLGRWPPEVASTVAVVPAGVDRATFPVLHQVPARLWQWRLAYFGRFDDRKGAHVAVRALANLPAGATLSLWGRGGEIERLRLETLADEIGVGDRVHFGRLDREDLAAAYAEADIVVFPSEWEEPFGLVPLEAMACGTPVIATAMGGSSEFLADEGNSLVVPAGDPAAIATAVRRLEADPTLRRRIVEGGLRTAAVLDMDRCALSMELLHERAITRVGPVPNPPALDIGAPTVAAVAQPHQHPPRVRVGIVSWNTAPLLDRCLAALPAALEGVDAHVVVVDNGSADDSAAVAEAHGLELVRNSTNLGYARAMNQALRAPTPWAEAPDVLIALNPDTEPGQGSLAELARRLMSQPRVGLISPRLVNPDGSTQHSVYRFPSPLVSFAVCTVPLRWQRGPIGRRLWLEGSADHERVAAVDWTIGAVHAIRAEAVAGRPPYSERWFMYVEDLELGWRLADEGWERQLAGDITVMHIGNVSGKVAWGDGRTARYLACTYDWYQQAHGRLAARAWAATSAVSLMWLLARLRVQAAMGSASSAHLFGRLRSDLPVHLGVVRRGPELPPDPAGGPTDEGGA